MRINLLGGISYLPLFAPEDEKTAAQKQRDSIKVQNNSGGELPKEEGENKEVEAKEETNEETEVKEEVEDNKEAIETSEEKIEELEEQLEAKGLTEKDRERLERRIEKERKKAKDLADENKALKAQLAARPDDEKVLTEEEVERRADIKAKELKLIDQFNADCEKLAVEAKKVDKEFDKKVGLMAEEIGNIPSQMIGILADLPNGGEVLSWMTNNLDDAEDYYKLSPARMALKLSKVSEELIAKKKKQISKAPPVKEKVAGGGANPDVLDPKKMDEFVRIRAKQVEERRKMKLGLH